MVLKSWSNRQTIAQPEELAGLVGAFSSLVGC
jgi:hypothetical protein